MQTQEAREVVYYKLPVFVVDMSIHLLVLLCLMRALPSSDLAGFIERQGGEVHLRMGLFALLALAYACSIAVCGLKLHERRIRPWYVIWRAMEQSVLTYMMFTFAVAMVYKEVPRHLLVMGLLTSTPLIVIAHTVANLGVRWIRQHGRNIRRMVIVGADSNALQLYDELSYGHSMSGYQVEGFFTSMDNPELPEDATWLGKVDDFWKWIERHQPDEVYCSLPPAQCQEEVNRLIKVCNDRFIEFYFVPTFDGYPKRHFNVSRLGKVNIIKLREEPLNSPIAKLMKRSFDLAVSGTFLCTLYPLVLLFVWIGNKLTGNVGPLYFKQARTGYNGESFMIYKFRSMKVNADADKLQATKDDPRKTPFGDFLRRSSIDELPQFINVFKGDMSVIGPRPHMEYHTEVYSAMISNYMVRHLAKPGITGWAQVSGCRGETKTVEEMADRVEHDIWYIEHWSAKLDAEIFFKTIWQVLPGHDKQAY